MSRTVRPGRNSRSALEPPVKALVVLVAAVLCVDAAFYSAITPLLPYDVRHHGLSTLGAGLLVAGYPGGMVLAALPSGVLAARLGARTALIAGVLLTGVSTVAFGLAPGLVLPVIARLVEGAAGACSWAGALAWLALAAPLERRAELIGAGYAAAAGGALLGPALGGLATVVGTGAAFSVAGVSAGLLAVLARRLPGPPPEERAGLRSVLTSLRNRQVLAGGVLVALAGLCVGVLEVLAPLRLGRLGASPVQVAVVFLAAAAIESLAAPRIGRIADRHGRRTLLLATLGTAAVCSLLAPTVRPVIALGVVVALGTPAFGALYTPATALMADGADRSAVPQGIAAAMLNLVWALAAAIGSSGSGLVTPHTGQIGPYLLVSGLCLGCLVAVAAQPRRRDEPLAAASRTAR